MWPDWDVAENLGGGSFGQVYEIHRDIFGQIDKAALKVLSIPKNKSDIQELRYNGYDDASITAHFKNHLADIVKEYNLMAQLKGCQNVVYCEDVRYIQDESGIGWDIYIKMELLKPLAVTLAMPVDEKQVIKIGMDICNALILCKEKGIIHRDIKPQNLFVSDDGTYKLGDFGIAKSIERTMGGTRTGTYNYMAPEVYNNQPQGTALDQYSLGMVLYWILNNRRVPFMPAPPAIPTASQEEEARAKRMSGSEPIPMPANGSEGLKAIVLKAIAHDPKDRYESPAAMRDALAALLKFGGQDPVIVEDKEAEIIAPVEGTIGNAWTFDEGSVGSEFNNMFNEFKTEGTVGVDNGPKVEPAPVTPVTPVTLQQTHTTPDVPVKEESAVYKYEGWARKPFSAFGLEQYFIDQTNVDEVSKMANSRAHEKGYIDIIARCNGIKSGNLENYCHNAALYLKKAYEQKNWGKSIGNQSIVLKNDESFSVSVSGLIWRELKMVFYYDPYNKEANELLKTIHTVAPLTALHAEQQKEYDIRVALMTSPDDYFGYQEACKFYKAFPYNIKYPNWDYMNSMWYFEKGKLIDRMSELKNDASYKEAVTAYIECAMYISDNSDDKSYYEKVEKTLSIAEAAGFDSAIIEKFRTRLSKKTAPKKGLFGGFFK